MKSGGLFSNMVNFKKHKYLLADIIFLLVVTSIPTLLRGYISDVLNGNKDTIYLALLLNFIFISIYILRYFFRPTHENITELYRKNWKITSYYSKYSLKDSNVYKKSYNRYVRFNIILLTALLLTTILLHSILGKIDKYLFLVIIVILVIFQVISWGLTYILEFKENNNKLD